MPILVTGGESKRWDRTPKSLVWTTQHRIRECPDLEPFRAVQAEAYDWAIEQLIRRPWLKVRGRTGEESLLKRLTRARADGTLPRENLCLQRAACVQVHLAFQSYQKRLNEKLELALLEQEEEEPSPRTLRQLAKPPRAKDTLLRSHPSKQHRRIAVNVLEGIRIADDEGYVIQFPGIGKIQLKDPVLEPPTSAQIVEKKGKLWLHVQHGQEVPEPKNPHGTVRGHDGGVRHTMTSDQGVHRERPDTSHLEEKARRLDKHRVKCCAKGSRNWKRYKRKATAIRKNIRNIHLNWERHTARDMSEETDVLVVENLNLRNMTASAKGTSSAPGKGVSPKREMNRSLSEARLGHLDAAIRRRCLKDGTWYVAVDPRNTSITCSLCEHKDRESRKDEQFHCSRCDAQLHADQNAGKNLRRRGKNVLDGFLRARGGGDRRPGGGNAPHRQGSDDIPGKTPYASHPTDRPGFAATPVTASGLTNNRMN